MKKSYLAYPFILAVLFLSACTSFSNDASKKPEAKENFTPVSADELIEVTPASVFTDHMIIQRNAPIVVWGEASPGWTVQVGFDGQTQTAKVSADGSWTLSFPAKAASAEPRSMSFNYLYPEGTEETWGDLVLEDIVLGDIWLCMGQSNMEFGISGMYDANMEITDSDYPDIRLFMVPRTSSPFPEKDLNAYWKPANPEDIADGGWYGFSAVAFTFGRSLYKELNVPIGLIQAAYGGSPIAPFIPRAEYDTNPSLGRDRKIIEKVDAQYQEALKSNEYAMHPWEGINSYDKLKPSICYNAMVAPYDKIAITGALWYQGEANVGNGRLYTSYMKALIEGYRTAFNNPELPFYYVQIAPWNYGGSLKGMWESQYEVLKMPHTGLALTVDVGDPDDIHPIHKREVGERLALQALHDAYGKTSVDPDGPIFSRAVREGNTIRLDFDHAASGLKTSDGAAPLAFSVMTGNNTWVPVQARISGSSIILSGIDLSQVSLVRYAWEDTPKVNLFDTDGLPARPFEEKVE